VDQTATSLGCMTSRTDYGQRSRKRAMRLTTPSKRKLCETYGRIYERNERPTYRKQQTLCHDTNCLRQMDPSLNRICLNNTSARYYPQWTSRS